MLKDTVRRSGGDASKPGEIFCLSHRRSESTTTSTSRDCNENWWAHENDYVFVECCVLCSLIILALVFDFLFEHLEHNLHTMHVADEIGRSSKNATDDEDDAPPVEAELVKEEKTNCCFIPANHVSDENWDDGTGPAHAGISDKYGKFRWARHHTTVYWKKLLDRFTMELRVLGFIAFSVWSGTQADLWHEFVPTDIDYANRPRNYLEMLEMVEDVHMHLFIAMCLHFVVIGRLVWTTSWIQHIQDMLEVFYAAYDAEHSDPPAPWKDFPSFKDHPDLKDFNPRSDDIKIRRLPRKYVGLHPSPVVACLQLFTSRITTLDTQDTLHVLRSFFMAHCISRRQRLTREAEDGDHFNFSLYIRVSTDEMLEDMVEFKQQSWMGCLLYYFCIGLLANFLPHGDSVEYVQLGFCVLLILLYIPINSWGVRKINHFMHYFKNRKGTAGDGDDHDLQDKPVDVAYERILRNSMQAITFINCYCLARVIGAKRFYTNDIYDDDSHPILTESVMLVVYLGSWIVNGFFLQPRSLPWITLLLSCPPYLAEDDVEVAEKVDKRRHHLTKLKAAKLLGRYGRRRGLSPEENDMFQKFCKTTLEEEEERIQHADVKNRPRALSRQEQICWDSIVSPTGVADSIASPTGVTSKEMDDGDHHTDDRISTSSTGQHPLHNVLQGAPEEQYV